MKNIAVFCGSAKGNRKIYEESAIRLAEVFLEYNLNLVYGGGSVGLMGVLADRMLEGQGKVFGVIPKKLYEWEVGHSQLTNLEIVSSMHERKARMADLSDGFIAIPGGIGTLDELIEIFTWLQLGYHNKPVALLNVDGYFDELIGFLNSSVREGFLKQSMLDELLIKKTPESIIQEFLNLESS